MKQIPIHMMDILRQRLDLEEGDSSKDDIIMKYSKTKIFSELCQWEGLIGGWDNQLLSWIETIWDVNLHQ